MDRNRLPSVLLLFIIILLGCNQSSLTPSANLSPIVHTALPCADTPSFEETIRKLASCLHPSADIAGIEHTLDQWDRIGHQWGGVSPANVAPGGQQEFVIRYHAPRVALSTPETRFAILQRGVEQWHILFDDKIALDNNTRWRTEIINIADATGDHYDDILLKLIYASTHFGFSYHLVLTAHPHDSGSQFHIAFAKPDDYHNTTFTFLPLADDQPNTIHAVEKFDRYRVITRTYVFDAPSFKLSKEVQFPQTAWDIPVEYRLAYDPDQDWHIYRCDVEQQTNKFVMQICGIKSGGSQKRIIMDELVSPILISPDKQQLIFAAPSQKASPYDCQNLLYQLTPSTEPRALFGPTDGFRICAVTELDWYKDGTKEGVAFRYWNGGRSERGDALPLERFYVDLEQGTVSILPED